MKTMKKSGYVNGLRDGSGYGSSPIYNKNIPITLLLPVFHEGAWELCNINLVLKHTVYSLSKPYFIIRISGKCAVYLLIHLEHCVTRVFSSECYTEKASCLSRDETPIYQLSNYSCVT
jgi:hypothetical protein